jgi:hypothetical protein
MALTLDGTSGISATGNIISSAGIISATGNIYGGNIIGTIAPSAITVSGNAQVGNLLTTGLISATGNITGNYLFGNASQVTGLSASKIFNGTSEANIGTSGGNANITIGGTSNVFVAATTGVYVSGVASASGNITGGNVLTAGLISATSTITSAATITGGNLATGGTASATGNITGGNILTAGLVSSTGNGIHGNVLTGGVVSATSTITGGNIATGGTASATGTITGGNLATGGTASATGNITGGNITTAGVLTVNSNNAATAIVNGGTNGGGNIGASGAGFNTVFAKATTAQYADLAEMYSADADYEPGTVVEFGGSYEVQQSRTTHATNVAGVISTKPAHLMNSGQTGPHVVPVALMGRVPTYVVGNVKQGDLMVASHLPGVATSLNSSKYQPGCVFGKALVAHQPTYDDDGNEIIGSIEVVIGRV